ncbi:MAG: tRNA uridine-5-carboxymethylaminomethyl(34) synthesis GTPase MnmE [Pseudomonadota bacterium]
MSQLTSALSADLIVAVATAPGMGGVGMVRLSGPDAVSVGEQITKRTLPFRQAVRADFIDPATKELLDQGLAIAFAHGQSFTGEEVVELHAHGSPVVLKQLVEACCFLGARIARPGEFSERAFSNQKLDLAQAEAIADLIASGSKAAARAAARSLTGEFSRRVFSLSEELEVLRVFVEAVIDFPEEEVEHLEQGQIRKKIDGLLEGLNTLLADARQGQLVNTGATVALIGPPNAGKSSLLNSLSGEDRAIVTAVPGTTRDALKVDLILDGIPIKIVDTAGLRISEDPVEIIGMERSRAEASTADILLVVLDVSLSDDRNLPRCFLPYNVHVHVSTK